MAIDYFNYSSLALLGILLLSFKMRRLNQGKRGMAFVWVIFACLLSTVFNILFNETQNLDIESGWFRAAIWSGYLICLIAALYLYLRYNSILTGHYYIIREKGHIAQAMRGLIALCAVALALNIIRPFMFGVDSNGGLIRYSGMAIVYIVPAVYIAYGLYMLSLYKHKMDRKKWVSLLAIYPVIVLVVIWQHFFENIQILSFASSLVLLYLSVELHRPEEIIDARTNLRNVTSFASDMERSLTGNRKMSIIYNTVLNYSVLYSIFNLESINETLRKVGEDIISISNELSARGDFYYLERGKFATVVDGPNREKALDMAERINSLSMSRNYFDDMSVLLDISTCVVNCPEDISDFHSLDEFGNAYYNEIAPDGHVHMADELISRKDYQLIRNMNAIIERGIDTHAFMVYYQPIYSVKEKAFRSAEALIRLKDEQFGFVSPELFIPIAEKNGTIHRIGSIVLEDVCKFVGSPEFKELGMDYIEVNLSTAQCMNKGLKSEIEKTMSDNGVHPSQINLEITETSASVAQDVMDANMEELTKMGVDFSLDDFGTGYSNISRLVNLPLKLIKLDRTLITTLERDKNEDAIRDIVSMIKNMDKEIVVEGIENEHMFHTFADLQCDYIQGYHFSKPLPRDEFIAFVRRHNIEGVPVA